MALGTVMCSVSVSDSDEDVSEESSSDSLDSSGSVLTGATAGFTGADSFGGIVLGTAIGAATGVLGTAIGSKAASESEPATEDDVSEESSASLEEPSGSILLVGPIDTFGVVGCCVGGTSDVMYFGMGVFFSKDPETIDPETANSIPKFWFPLSNNSTDIGVLHLECRLSSSSSEDVPSDRSDEKEDEAEEDSLAEDASAESTGIAIVLGGWWSFGNCGVWETLGINSSLSVDSDSDESDASQASGGDAVEVLGIVVSKASSCLDGNDLHPPRGAASRASEAAIKASVASNVAWEAARTCIANCVRLRVLALTAASVKRVAAGRLDVLRSSRGFMSGISVGS